MPLPEKVIYLTEDEYRQHFYRVYCASEISTFDGIPVRFRRDDFEHCMYESSKRDGCKDQFSKERSERIDWIKATLENPDADLYQGWDSRKKCIDPDSRVAVVYEQYVVIIHTWLKTDGKRAARFVTAYQADNSIGKIRAKPKWGTK